MSDKPVTITEGIVQFQGKVSRNLLLEPMVSNAYLLEDGDEVVIFDPSCGKKVARAIESHIRERRDSVVWKRALVLAGHSHIDHANNFYLADLLGAQESHVYLHERGFDNGQVCNDPFRFIVKSVEGWSEYYNPYWSFYGSYALIMAPMAAVHSLSPSLARILFGAIGAIPWPRPRNGSAVPEPLRDDDLEQIDLGGSIVAGWRLGNKVVLPTPGHSPCSVSLYWPDRKALFISDADYIGNPIFTTSSMSDCISSLKTMKELAEAGKVELLFPAHGLVREGQAQITASLGYGLRRLEVMRDEVRIAYRSTGEKDVRRLTNLLIRQSPTFQTLKFINFPRLMAFANNVVAVCLHEDGILK